MSFAEQVEEQDTLDIGASQCSTISLPIPIPIINNKAFLFDLDHIKYLRENYGITGILSGILPIAPQQNQLLGIPLRLSLEEVLYLIGEKVCFVVDNPKRLHRFWSVDLQEDDKTDLKNQYEESIQDQILRKRQEYEKKMLSMNLSARTDDNSDNNDAFFIGAQDKSMSNDMRPDLILKYNDYDIQKQILIQFIKANCKYNEGLDKSLLNYRIYKSLKKSNDFYILPGLRFGGKYIAYPGDPLRYHAHLIINTRDYYNDDIGLLEIVNGGRLATSVKKLWCICGTTAKDVNRVSEDQFVEEITREEKKKEEQTVTFSVEWAGFG